MTLTTAIMTGASVSSSLTSARASALPLPEPSLLTSPVSPLSGQLKYLIPQMKLCLVQEGPALDFYPIKTPFDAAALFAPIKLAAEEHFVSLHLNSKHEAIGLHEVSHGTISASLVHPREVFKAALLANSYAIIVCHNHPSGSRLFASKDDLNTTEQLVKCANIMGIPLLDHLIINRHDEVYSIRENHAQLWPSEKPI